MHPAVIAKNLGVWLDVNISLADPVYSICKTFSILMGDFRWVRQYLRVETAILVGYTLVCDYLDDNNSRYDVCPVLTCPNSSGFIIHLLGLSQTVTDTHPLFSKSSICYQASVWYQHDFVYGIIIIELISGVAP